MRNSTKTTRNNFLSQFGEKLINLGYRTIPIKDGEKFPKGIKGWQNKTLNKKGVSRLSRKNFTGIGVFCGSVIAIDIDVLDEDITKQMCEYCYSHLGTAPQRVGKSPKVLLPYQTKFPFKKITSKIYLDSFGFEHRVEILGEGQQFVAYGWHPDTGKPYHYPQIELAEIPQNELALITEQQAKEFVNYFESIMEASDDFQQAYTKKKPKNKYTKNEATSSTKKPKISEEKIQRVLDYLDSDDYDIWCKVGMALHNQFQGKDKGFKLWDLWSQKSNKYENNKDGEIQRKWASFNSDSSIQLITFATPLSWFYEGHKDTIKKTLTQLKNDVGAAYESDVIEALREIKSRNIADYMRYRDKFKKANQKTQTTQIDKLVDDISLEEDGVTEDDSVSGFIVNYFRKNSTLFHNAEGTPYCRFEHNDHFEVWGLNSMGFREYVALIVYKNLDCAARDLAISDAIVTLSASAKFDGEEHEVYLRYAKSDDYYYIDLVNADWQVVEVSSAGFRVLNDSPIYFSRMGTMKPLPTPLETGNIDLLWNSINIPKHMRGVALTWMIESMRVDTPYTIMELSGEQGSGKSDTQERIRMLIDPSAVNLRGEPEKNEDIYIAANNGHLISLNNLSNISAKQQDIFCTVATGGGSSSRKLYSNGEEYLIDAKRPILINGISTLATRPDMADRTVRLELPTIPGEQRRSASDLVTEFNKNAPTIFTGLLELFSNSLDILPKIRLEKLPRMADFAILGEAVFQALDEPVSFSKVYGEIRHSASINALDTSPVARAILDMMDERQTPFKGTMKQLLEQLEYWNEVGSSRSWPRSPRGLGDAIRRNAPSLRLTGVEVWLDPQRYSDGFHVHISKKV